ncbi:MAG: PD-(D/E)XK nuclease family protein, partial [Nitrosomonas sp.]
MSDSPQFPHIPLTEVLERINAGTTVVTPNRRLALALKEKFNQIQISQKRAVWYSVDVLPFSTLIERIYLDALYAKQSLKLPLLLSAAQEQVLWESIIQSSATGKTLLRIAQTAQLAREAWQLAHAWQITDHLGDGYPNEDGRAFLDWASAYQEITKRNWQADHARITDLVTEQYASFDIKKPPSLICYGFDIFTPQQNAFLRKLTAAGCGISVAALPAQSPQSSGAVRRMEYPSSRDEIYQAAL